MSLAFPEGECFFNRSALRTSTYDPNKPEHFYAHMLVEYIWNKPAYVGKESEYNRDIHYHPRCPYKVVKGDFWNTHYGNWSKVVFLYGKKPHSDRYRQAEHDLCVSGNRFRDYDKGGALESWFMVMPMPLLANGEEWVLIDRTACIRAIYIPVAQEAGEDYPEICTFLQVNFAVEREVRMMAHAEINDWENRRYIVVDREETCKLDTTLGLTNDAACIILVDRKLTPTKGPAQLFSSSADLSWLTIAKANYGLSLQWQPPQPTTWLAGFLKNTLTVAVGFIPIVGPIAAVCFPLAWTAVAEPDVLLKTVRDLIPVSDLAMKVVEEIRKSAQEQEAYLPKGWSAFRLPAAVPQGEAATGGAQAKAKATSEPIKKQDDAAQKAREATVKKFESIRKFKYWNVMKSAPPSATSTEVTKQAEEPDIPPQQAVQVASVPEAPPKPSLDDLKPSTTFQLAGQILLHSGDTSNVTDTEDDTMGGTIEEVFPETSTSPEDSDFNWYDWMEEYLAEEFSLAADEQMEE